MRTNHYFKDAAPYALAAGALATAGLWMWSKTRVSIPDGAIPVTNFDINRYLGQWYEIARFDYRFERGLQNVTAYYSLNTDGSVKVVNRGVRMDNSEWESSVGKARFVDEEPTGRLKVSFFGPFYAAYNVIALDDDYQYAMIAGNDLDYLWLLSRAPVMPAEIRNVFLQQAKAIGYDVGRLIWTKQQAADEVPIETVS
ncbi:apolipoprotein D and lipocalin family protein [Mucilaginibacter yixingensis]|uniref:Outer membrane lipoprotein Blc n=1 Tax=Mucilaginibacter yixingensis TaxID=1295612 RepID=A0A2T5J697_9SPHI|nr:lipocalin family protein [Mucilaginibacter yixingensis]PTQ94019.1 apolipoprotein D and lipocalin family protein [Mucilaginibacter yixingensis]